MGYGVIAGFNTTPMDLHLMSPPLFKMYALGVDDSWLPLRETNADLSSVVVARRVLWTLPAISQAEWDYLLTNTFSGAQSAEVTVSTSDRGTSANPFTLYNAIAQWFEYGNQGTAQFLRNGFWQGVALEFYILEEASP